VLKRWLKKNLPDKKSIINNLSPRVISNYLGQSNVWCFNCNSIARGTAIGLFCAFIPLSLQMLIAAFLSILFRGNLPVATIMTWVTNPLTFIPINYLIYIVGKIILGESSVAVPSISLQFKSFSLFGSSLFSITSQFGKAYLVGLPFVAIGVAVLGYFIVRLTWYLNGVISRYRKKKNI
jgi:uncharacterized protein (DUF2062 family)